MTIELPSHTAVSQPPAHVHLQAPETWHLSLPFGAGSLPNDCWIVLASEPPDAAPAAGDSSITTSGGHTVGLPTFINPTPDNAWDQVTGLMERSSFRFLADEPDLYSEADCDAV